MIKINSIRYNIFIFTKKTMSEDINWALLRSFVWPHEYYMLQAFLESNGIRVKLRDEITITVDPLLSNAIGGIKMYVDERDIERATALTAEFDKNRTTEAEEKEDESENNSK